MSRSYLWVHFRKKWTLGSKLEVQGRGERSLGSLALALAPLNSPGLFTCMMGAVRPQRSGKCIIQGLLSSHLPPLVRTVTLTTPSSAGALSPTTSITGQLGDRGEGSSGQGLGQRQGTSWRAGRSHSPECLGIGHCPRPVNVKVSAAVEEGKGKEGILGVDPNTANW